MTQALEHRFGFGVGDQLRRYPEALRCRWVTQFRSHCEFGVALGDTAYVGQGIIWLVQCTKAGSGGWCWGSVFTARVINEYCYFVEERPLKACTRRVHVKW